MPEPPAKPAATSQRSGARRDSDSERFAGFTRPTANFVRCPNQYLDLCVPHCSVHVARLVGYLIRETIGWVKHNGEPRRQKVSVTYSELVGRAGVSRSKLRPAIDEAIELGFLVCTRQPVRQTSGVAARSGVYELHWDESGLLTRSLDEFAGFKFGGDCRTPVPNQFFDRVLPAEKHSVIRVVSAVLRHTVGYTNGITGERLESAPLSYNRLLAFSPMDRKTLATAIRETEAAGYIRRVLAGRFSHNEAERRAAVYAVRWHDDEAPITIGSAIPPASAKPKRSRNSTRGKTDGPPIPPAKKPPARFTDSTSHGAAPPPADRFTPSTTRKTAKQTQQQRPPKNTAAAVLEELQAVGFDKSAARALCRRHSPDVIERQLAWLPRRRASRNRLGLLRRAIEEDWAEPKAEPKTTKSAERTGPTKADRERLDEARCQRLMPAYLAFVASLEPALARNHGGRFAAFLGERATKRAALQANEKFSPRMKVNVLRQFDSQEARLQDLVEAFAGEIPTLQEWASTEK